MPLLLVILLLAAAVHVPAQTLYFPTNVPSNWSAAKGSLAISTNHYKEPVAPLQCLQWNYGTNDTLTVTNPGIAAADVTDFYKHTCDLWVYNPLPLPGRKVTFQFVSANGTAQYAFDFYLNYSGWRHAVRSYKYDMDGPAGNATFTKVSIVGPTNVSGQLFFDAITWVGPRFTRVEDPQNVDITGYLSTDDNYHCYNQMPSPDIPTNTPTPQELADLAAARANWLADNAGSAPSGSSLSSAYASWTNLNIVVNGTNISGPVINDNGTADNYYSWLSTIAQDIFWNTNANSSAKMNLFLQNWWDQGMESNSCASTANGSASYTFRTVPLSFILGYNGYDASTKQHLWQMFHWMYRLGGYWSTNWTPGLPAAGLDDSELTGIGTDDIYLNTRRHLGAILFLTPDDMTAIQYLKGYKRYIERFLTPHNGTDDGVKTDGCGFHHAGHHNHYMYAFNEMTSVLNDLAGTQFEISSNAYLNLRGAILAEVRMGNTPDATNPSGVGFAANSLNGRNPFSNNLTPDYGTLQTLGSLGGSILGQAVDPMVARVYNRICGASYPYSAFAPYGAEANPEGFYQFNYSPIGVYRQTNWVACIHGMNNDFWGTEIFNNANVYGRYQSYGALEILGPGGYAASGWSLSGWDWNKPPGTTTIVLPWTNLFGAGAGTFSEHDYSATNFAGGLAFHSGGNNIQNGIYGGFGGLYACNFLVATNSYEPTPLAWRKSYFCFTNQIICLGSNITNNDAANPTITTLFQSMLTNTSAATVLNGANVTAFPNSLTNNDAAADWLLDGQGTGYFVRPGSPLRLDRTAQISPDQSGNGAFSTNNYATAWIDHGKAPSGAGYEYVVVPNTTSNAMSQLATNYTNTIATPYTVLERDAIAHVVQWKPDGRIGCALFATNALAAAVTNAGSLRSVSLPCMAMVQPINGTLWLAVVNPDLNLVNNVSTPTNLTVKLAGIWAMASGYTNATVLSTNAGVTTLQMQTADGLPVEALLLAVSNSLTPPIGVTATAVATNQINVAWLSVSNATGYIVQRDGANIANVSGISYTNTGLASGTTYTYTVLATNAGGVSPQSQPATTTTPTIGVPPAAGSTIYWDADISTGGDQDGNGIWDASSLNWLNGGGNVKWVDNCTAVFGAGPGINYTVTLGANVSPAGITVNAGSVYTLAGNNTISTANGLNLAANGFGVISAPITGSKGVTNTGTGTLTLSGSNTYTGGTTVSAGSISVNNNQSAATGGWNVTSGTADASFNSGSTVVVAAGKTISLGGNASSGSNLDVAGTVTNNGSLSISRRAVLNLNSGANWNQTGTVSIVPVSNTGYYANLNLYSGATFTYTGAGAMGVSPCSGASGWGVLTIAGGTLVTGQGFANTTASSSGSGQIAFNSGGTLRLTANIANLYGSAGSTNSVTLDAGGGTIDTAGFSLTVTNVISGSGNLTKLGLGTLTLTASNSCSGDTAVNGGTLLVNGSLGVGGVFVATNATLAGTGNIGGSVTVQSGGTLMPGNGGLGTLTLNSLTLSNGALTVAQISRNAGVLSNDLVSVAGAVKMGGTLTVSNIGPNALVAGDTFALFNAGTCSNSFTTVNLPALNAGLVWKTNNLAVNGTIAVSNITYTLTYTAGTNGSISGTTPQIVNYGGGGTAVTAVPNTGYSFVNWSDGSTANPRTDVNVTNNISVTANFTSSGYTLTYLAGPNGGISGTSPQTVSYGGSGSAVTAVANTNYHFVNWSDGSTANPRTDVNVTNSLTVTANFTNGLPPPWTTNVVGTVSAAVTANYSGKTFAVSGAGAGLAGKSDSFYFVNLPAINSFTLTALVTSQQTNGGAPLAGVMIRQDTSANSLFAFMGLAPTNQAKWISRTSTHGNSSTTTFSNPPAPYWVKVVRDTNSFTGFVSADGVTWTQTVSLSITMNSNVLAGLAVSSGASGTLNTAVFDNVTVTNSSGGVFFKSNLLVQASARMNGFSVSGGTANFTIVGDRDTLWQVEESNDMITWTPLESINLIGGNVDHAQGDDALPKRFFRLVLAP